MSKFHINSLFDPATGVTCLQSPAVLMFERLVGDMQSTLQEEVWFDDSDWPLGFDWQCEADAVWEGLAEDALLLARFRTRNAGARLLCRGAGLIQRAIRAETVLELEAVLNRFVSSLQGPAPAHVRFLLSEGLACLEQMADLSRASGSRGPDAGLGLSRAA